MLIGSPSEWVDLLDSWVPDILALVIAAWDTMPAPAANAKEDPLSASLCRILSRSRDRCNLPFRIASQHAELDPAAGEDQGCMDIVFLPMTPEEDIYFCLECKRINVRGPEGMRPYFAEYIQLGMLRFVRGQYAKAVRSGGMLAFVLDGDVARAIAGIEKNIAANAQQLGMALPATFRRSRARPDDQRTRETEHRRASGERTFILHHLFLAGDPDAPLLPESEPTPATTKPRRRTRRRAAGGP